MKSIEKATAEDSSGNYEDAFKSYQTGLDYFMKAIDGIIFYFYFCYFYFYFLFDKITDILLFF